MKRAPWLAVAVALGLWVGYRLRRAPEPEDDRAAFEAMRSWGMRSLRGYLNKRRRVTPERARLMGAM